MTFRFALLGAALSVGSTWLVLACGGSNMSGSSSSTGTEEEPADASRNPSRDGSDRSPDADDGAPYAADAASPDSSDASTSTSTDGAAGPCTLVPGNYLAHYTLVPGGNAFGGPCVQLPDQILSIPGLGIDAGLMDAGSSGCTVESQPGCVSTTVCTNDNTNLGVTTMSTGTLTITDNGTAAHGRHTSTWVSDVDGGVELDCTYEDTMIKQ